MASVVLRVLAVDDPVFNDTINKGVVAGIVDAPQRWLTNDLLDARALICNHGGKG